MWISSYFNCLKMVENKAKHFTDTNSCNCSGTTYLSIQFWLYRYSKHKHVLVYLLLTITYCQWKKCNSLYNKINVFPEIQHPYNILVTLIMQRWWTTDPFSWYQVFQIATQAPEFNISQNHTPLCKLKNVIIQRKKHYILFLMLFITKYFHLRSTYNVT